MKNTILILTSFADKSIDSVVENLERMKEKFFRFDTETFPKEAELKLVLKNNDLSGYIQNKDGKLIEIEKIKSCWYRGVMLPQKQNEMEEKYFRFIKEESKAALWSFYTNLNVFWMNHPLFGSRLLEANKLFQMNAASNVGLRVPDSIITNSPEELLFFCREHGGEIAVKMISGHVFSMVGRNKTFYIYTQKVKEKELLKRIENIKLTPILAQEYINKQIELRVTIVNREIFTCAIYSQNSERTKNDWRRYDFENVKHEKYDLPKEIEEKLLILMDLWNITFGAIDLILTPDGECVFLEINPHGQWGWIENLTDMSISLKIAETLSNPPETGLIFDSIFKF